MRRIGTALVLAVAIVAAGCDDEDSTFEGRFSVQVFETEDTCDGTTNGFQVELRIDRVGDNRFTVAFGDDAVLEGSLNSDGILVTQGTSTAGGFEADMQVNILVRRDLLEGNGVLVFDGTFPGVDGVCTQEFNLTRGSRLNLTPSMPTEAG